MHKKHIDSLCSLSHKIFDIFAKILYNKIKATEMVLFNILIR